MFQVGDHHFAGASSNRISSLAFVVEGRIPGEREIIRQHMIGLHDPGYADMDPEKIAPLCNLTVKIGLFNWHLLNLVNIPWPPSVMT